MEFRTLGRTQLNVSVVGLGYWRLGADWGDVSEDEALDVRIYDERIRQHVHARW